MSNKQEVKELTEEAMSVLIIECIAMDGWVHGHNGDTFYWINKDLEVRRTSELLSFYKKQLKLPETTAAEYYQQEIAKLKEALFTECGFFFGRGQVYQQGKFSIANGIDVKLFELRHFLDKLKIKYDIK